MGLVRKIRSFLHSDPQLKWIFFQAFFLSGLVKFTLVFLSFRKVLNWQGAMQVESPEGADLKTDAYRRNVQLALRLCHLYTPWKSECYTRALTAKILLKRKGIPSTVYIGFRKEPNGTYAGHAWLRSYDRIVTGREEMNGYIVHSFYS
jgi:hypothetical protein